MIARVPLFARIAIIFLIQAGVILWMVWDRSQILNDGQVVRLQVRPVDPRDIFRGDYVTLNYDISSLRPSNLGSSEKFEKHEVVFVGLEENSDGAWVANSIFHILPENMESTIFISGRVKYAGTFSASVSERAQCPDQSCQQLSIRYGIESYFVPEGEGKDIENARNEMDVVILAAIAANGRAAIKGLIMDGKLRYEEPLF